MRWASTESGDEAVTSGASHTGVDETAPGPVPPTADATGIPLEGDATPELGTRVDDAIILDEPPRTGGAGSSGV